MLMQENKELQKLANINKDASEFYHEAHDEVESNALKKTFLDLEQLHRDVYQTIHGKILANGGTSEAEETVVGKAQETFGILMSKISSNPDKTLVTHLEEAEDRCLHSMEDAVANDVFLPETKTMLAGELNALKKSHDYMKAIKDSIKDAA
ncbi:MAG: PA2169 family four-helix-bundle protein [Alcanivorax sp.]